MLRTRAQGLPVRRPHAQTLHLQQTSAQQTSEAWQERLRSGADEVEACAQGWQTQLLAEGEKWQQQALALRGTHDAKAAEFLRAQLAEARGEPREGVPPEA